MFERRQTSLQSISTIHVIRGSSSGHHASLRQISQINKDVKALKMEESTEAMNSHGSNISFPLFSNDKELNLICFPEITGQDRKKLDHLSGKTNNISEKMTITCSLL